MSRRSINTIWVGLVAVMVFHSYVKAQPSQALELNNEGVKAFNAGDFDQAIQLLEKACSLAPDSTIVQRNLCNACQSKANEFGLRQEYRSAIPYLDRALRVDPSNASPRIQLGSYYLNLGDVNTAIVHLEEAIRLTPGELNAHELLGQAYYMDNDLSSARAQWDYVLEMEPNRPGLQERYDKAFREESVEYDFNKWKSRHFRISYPPNVPVAVRRNVSSILDRAYIDIGRIFGGIYPTPPIYVILYTAEQFSEATRLDEHIGAVYDGKIRSPLTDTKGVWLPEDELNRRLVHEYVHVVVRFIANEHVPWWLNEGLAETLSSTLNEADIQQLRDIYGTGKHFALSRLEGSEARSLDADSLRVAYLQSHATVEFLWKRFGRIKMMTFLRAMSSGMNTEEAFHSAYHRKYSSLDWDIAGLYR
jgi:Tfp pilus assembly protein PilF